MTLEEKLAQLGAVWAFEVVGETGVDGGRGWRADAGTGIGQVTRLAGSTNLRPVEVAQAANAIQRHLVEETRLGIPAIIHEECLHGLLALGRAVLPAVDRGGGDVRPRPRRGGGGHHPPADAGDRRRGRRWRRSWTSRATRGGAGSRRRTARIPTSRPSSAWRTSAGSRAATRRGRRSRPAKHLVGHGLPEGGLNQAPAHVGPRELARRAPVPVRGRRPRGRRWRAVMPAYCDVDGVPCHASRRAARRRSCGDEWGFDGLVVVRLHGHRRWSTRPIASPATWATRRVDGARGGRRHRSCRGPLPTASRSARRSRTGALTWRRSTRRSRTCSG